MLKRRVAILASGGGTTAQAFIESCAQKKVSADVVLIISNQKSPGVFNKVKELNQRYNLNIKCLHIGKDNFPEQPSEQVLYGRQTNAEEEAILKALIENKIDLVMLLGYMKLVGKSIVAQYGWRSNYKSVYQANMLNTHPGILPYTKGLFGIHVQKYCILNQTPAGHCIFAVDNEYDDGPIISEHRVEVKSDDTPETLFERVKESERANLADDIQKFLTEQAEFIKNKNNE